MLIKLFGSVYGEKYNLLLTVGHLLLLTPIKFADPL